VRLSLAWRVLELEQLASPRGECSRLDREEAGGRLHARQVDSASEAPKPEASSRDEHQTDVRRGAVDRRSAGGDQEHDERPDRPRAGWVKSATARTADSTGICRRDPVRRRGLLLPRGEAE
jgi:hypothetical protein